MDSRGFKIVSGSLLAISFAAAGALVANAQTPTGSVPGTYTKQAPITPFTPGTNPAGVPLTASAGKGTGMLGSPHDFANYSAVTGATRNRAGFDTSTGARSTTINTSATPATPTASFNPTAEVCIVCHIPHAANSKGLDANNNPTSLQGSGYLPLWSRAVTNQTFTPYSSKTMRVNMTGVQPDGISILCLSCHDGTIALDQFKTFGSFKTSIDDWSQGSSIGSIYGAAGQDVYKGAPGAPAMGVYAPNKNLGTDLSNDHPIGFSYADAVASFTASGMDPQLATANGDLVLGTYGILPLYEGKVSCATCHAVHNKDAFGNTMGNNLTRIDNSKGSALCLNCHTK